MSSKLNDNIYLARKNAGLTMEELGKSVGVSKVTIKKYESGLIKNIPSDKIEKISKATGVSESELMGWSEELFNNKKYDVNKRKMLLIDQEDIEIVEAYTQLPPEQKSLIKNLIMQFKKDS